MVTRPSLSPAVERLQTAPLLHVGFKFDELVRHLRPRTEFTTRITSEASSLFMPQGSLEAMLKG